MHELALDWPLYVGEVNFGQAAIPGVGLASLDDGPGLWNGLASLTPDRRE
jgi:hypothetical protein